MAIVKNYMHGACRVIVQDHIWVSGRGIAGNENCIRDGTWIRKILGK